MWSSSSASDVDELFPRRPRRVFHSSIPSSTRRSTTTSCFEQHRRDLSPPSVSRGNLWTFEGSSTASTAFHTSSAATTGFCDASKSLLVSEETNEGPHGLESDVKAVNHGVIGSYPSDKATTRMLWNRPEREEEEREEEALPSYLSYLQAPLLMGDATATAIPTSVSFVPATTLGRTSDEQMETWSKELARVMQQMISVQMQRQEGMTTTSSPMQDAGKSCNCEMRVAELEKQVQIMIAAQKEMTKSAAMEETRKVISERVSTLEGRQSAFQSQLAQISKVLGVPVGKHGKSSQLKTLVQTLHEEIDTKVQAAVANIEAAYNNNTTMRAEELPASSLSPTEASAAPSNPSEEKKRQSLNGSDSTPISALSFSTVLNALAEEHEASLTRLSTHFDERLRLEGSQRIALEGRMQARLGELDDWLQQVEGELGGSHFEPTPSSSIVAITDDMTRLENQLGKLETSWKHQQQEVKELCTQMEKQLPNFENLCTQLDQQNSDVKALRESLETVASSACEETQAVARTFQGLKLIVEKLVRDTGSVDELLQQYVSTITHQVASVTRQYVSVRIRDNNRLLDATLRARVPDYVLNESESFLLVRRDKKRKGDGHNFRTDVNEEPEDHFSFVVRENDEDGIRRILTSQRVVPKPSPTSPTISSDASASAVVAGATASL
ncbi:unnamed protein product [Peronospora belbahrii]|uniref:Uncharacterized protein n=1 Tax=Peronospora belbahrii TaxID=622444 RepID=A0AAU9KQY8_9STRA|nr:unnamed protein product [Peronospora belbahrii]CAH0513245.1 unnamed protein product [Peronospora belbahrii]